MNVRFRLSFFLTLFLMLVLTETPITSQETSEQNTTGHTEGQTEGLNTTFNLASILEKLLGQDETDEKSEDEPSEESKTKLAQLFDQMDVDDDDKLSEEELREWITKIRERFVKSEAEKFREKIIRQNETEIKWEDYAQHIYKRTDTPESVSEEGGSISEIQGQMMRDRRRWVTANRDKSEGLALDELQAFMHPEDYIWMDDTVIDDLLDQLDSNGDGLLEFAEYFADLLEGGVKEEEKEPDWLSAEREEFSARAGSDGKMNREKIKDWLIVPREEQIKKETEQLLQQADSDKDGYLSEEEVLKSFGVFAGSGATQYGQALRDHDEL